MGAQRLAQFAGGGGGQAHLDGTEGRRRGGGDLENALHGAADFVEHAEVDEAPGVGLGGAGGRRSPDFTGTAPEAGAEARERFEDAAGGRPLAQGVESGRNGLDGVRDMADDRPGGRNARERAGIEMEAVGETGRLEAEVSVFASTAP